MHNNSMSVMLIVLVCVCMFLAPPNVKKIILAQIVDKLHVHQLLSKVANCKFAVRFAR